MRRRAFLATTTAAALATPAIVRAQSATTLKFIPYTNPPVLDPIVTNNYAVRNHALMVFDTLYGIDDDYEPQPQVAAGHVVEEDGRLWTITLRDGLRFHDGTPVLGRDVVASLRRWAIRDGLGGSLMAATSDLSAPSDRTVRFRLKTPFPLLPFALGKATLNVAVIMPERLAASDPFKPVSEMVGSGPFRFVAADFIGGERSVYQRFVDYVPRQSGSASFLAGPKIAHFDRVEWHILTDPATAAGALQKGEMDWWELPTSEYWPLLKRHEALRVELLDRSGSYGLCSLNHLQPPFDNVATRRAALAAISQMDVQIAGYGTDPAMWRSGVGFFPPDSAMASADRMAALKEPPDLNQAARMLKDSGYRGQKTAILYNPAVPWLNAAAQVVAQAWRTVGFDVELVGDMTTLVKHLGNKGPVDAGGWSAEIDAMSGLAADIPVSNYLMRGDGSTYGWANIPRMEALRSAWFAAPDLAARQDIARQMQALCFDQVPYIPTGLALRPTAYRKSLTGVLHGVPLFYNVRRA